MHQRTFGGWTELGEGHPTAPSSDDSHPPSLDSRSWSIMALNDFAQLVRSLRAVSNPVSSMASSRNARAARTGVTF